jgi:L-lysine exporter family protein LysE/ArgO
MASIFYDLLGEPAMWQSYLNGMLVAFGLIMAIGAQNAFVLAQSLRREHHLPVAALCIVCDALLVAAGVFGLATVLAQTRPCWRWPAGAARCS